MELPYEGYRWVFTQHAVAFDERPLRTLLEAASRFDGREPDRDAINEYIVSSGVLTRNIRSDTEQVEAWRDYQQVLPELGLMVSRTVSRRIKITPIGWEYLDDDGLSHKQLMTTQAFRYQYPNGFHVRNHFDQQLRNEVLIKPAPLLLLAIRGLEREGADPWLSVDEVQEFLLPIHSFDESIPFDDIVSSRVAGLNSTLGGSSARRSVQDWFRFLDHTEVFGLDDDGRLREADTNEIQADLTDSFLEAQLTPEAFWTGDGGSEAWGRSAWFDYYGSADLNVQWIERPEEAQREGISLQRSASINLRDVDPDTLREEASSDDSSDSSDGATSPTPEDGTLAREKRNRLHQTIVAELTDHYRSRGLSVYEDPNSVDLLLEGDSAEAIVEVKTVTPENLFRQLRVGVGQVLEYQYRRGLDSNTTPQIGLAISHNLQSRSWLQDFVARHLQMTLIARKTEGVYTSIVDLEELPSIGLDATNEG